MNLITRKIKRIGDIGIKDSLRTIYFNRIRRPIFKKYVRNKYQNQKSGLSDTEFFGLIKLNQNKNKLTEKSNLLSHFKNRSAPLFFSSCTDEAKKIFLENYSKKIEITLNRADRIFINDFKWITPRCPQFIGEVNWHSTFNENSSWQLEFFMDLDYSSEKRPGDVREVWELNRHQFFITLGKAYFITGDEKYSEKFTELLSSWIKANPCGYGINWLHSQETGIRIMSWIWAYYFFKDSVLFTDDLKIEFFKSLYQHAEYTYLTLSHGLVTHNHLVSEICGMLMFSLMFPEFKKSSSWLKNSIKIYKREVLKQIWESGPSGELSTNYHLFVLDSFLQTYVLLQQNGYQLSNKIKNRIEMMIEYASFIIRPDGTIPKIGDNDSGRTFKLSESDENERRYHLAAGSVLFKRADFKKLSPKFSEEAFWLLGKDGLNKFVEIEVHKDVELSKYFEPTGFAVFRDGISNEAAHLVFRGGPEQLRKNVSTSHNHADFLSFELFNNGQSIFIDPGTYLYSLHDDWRFYYRKSFCHNTVTVDELDSADVTASRFGLPAVPLSSLNSIQHNSGFDFIDMTNFGYEFAGVKHRRKLLFVKHKYILILDLLYGDEKHKITQNLNTNVSGANIDIKNNEICLSCSNDLDSMSVLIFSSYEPQTSISEGNINPIDGWASDKYGEKHASSIIRINYLEKLPIVCGLLINLNSKNKLEVQSHLMNHDYQKIEILSEGYVERIECTGSTLNYHSDNK